MVLPEKSMVFLCFPCVFSWSLLAFTIFLGVSGCRLRHAAEDPLGQAGRPHGSHREKKEKKMPKTPKPKSKSSPTFPPPTSPPSTPLPPPVRTPRFLRQAIADLAVGPVVGLSLPYAEIGRKCRATENRVVF